jgi:hypothetical protein
MMQKSLNVADRDYFREAIRHARPFIGGVFRGRGFGDDLVVAISTPIFDGDGRPRYVLEGSLNLEALIDALSANGHLRDRQLVIADGAKNVVLTVGYLSIPALSDFSGHMLYRSLSKSSKATVFDLHPPGKSRAERHLVLNTHTAVQKWQIVLLEPIWLTQKEKRAREDAAAAAREAASEPQAPAKKPGFFSRLLERAQKPL